EEARTPARAGMTVIAGALDSYPPGPREHPRGESMWQLASSPPSETETPFPQRYQKLKSDIHRQLVETVDITMLGRWRPGRRHSELRQLAAQMAQETPEMLNEVERERLIGEVLDEAFGLGPLQPFMNDPTISDILVNSPKTVYVERFGRLEETDVVFA